MAVTTKHSSAFKESDLVSHNKKLVKMRENFVKCNLDPACIVDATVSDFTSKPGVYAKFKGQWEGPFESVEAAIDEVEELRWQIWAWGSPGA